MSSLHENYHVAKESFATLEHATNLQAADSSEASRSSSQTGNRMNDGTYRGGAQAFKLDTLLKLSDVKGTDGKTTLLSFVVQEIIRYEGIKVARHQGLEPNNESPEHLKMLGMEVVSKLSEELNDVKKASIIDGEMLTSTVSKLGNMLKKTKEFMNEEMKKAEGATEFINALTRFLEYAEADIKWMIEEEKRIMAVVKSTADYFHGNLEKTKAYDCFAIVRDFLKDIG
ncbi:putative formin, FH2 domain-containing protein [Helianthus annuus]|nr:putative formin, FH2 domain-containing protein [Helianthus annuus]